MKRILLTACVLLSLVFVAPSGAYSSSKRVDFPPPKHATTTTTTRPPTTTTLAPTTTTTLAPTTTTTIPTVILPPVVLFLPPDPPTDVSYGMRPDHLLQLRWEYTSRTYNNVGIMTCFYANGVSLCGDGIDYGRDGDYYVAVLTKPALFGGAFPLCVRVAVQYWTDDGWYSPLVNAATYTCQGQYS